MNIQTVYLHLGWGMNYPFSPRSWCAKEWDLYCSKLGVMGLKRVMLWPGFEFVNFRNKKEEEAIQQRCKNVMEASRKNGLEVWLGRSVNAVLKQNGIPFEKRDARHCEVVNVCSEEYQTRVIDPLRNCFKNLDAPDGWWCIDRDPGSSMGQNAEDFSTALLRQFEATKAKVSIYWMWGGWCENLNQASGWRLTEQDFWTSAIEACQKQMGDSMQYLACWDGHLQSLGRFKETNHHLFPYHALEAEPSLPFSYHRSEIDHSVPLKISDAPAILNLQTPCLRSSHLASWMKHKSPLKDHASSLWEDIERFWCWSEISLENLRQPWTEVFDAIESSSLNNEIYHKWARYCGADFPVKRGVLKNLLL